LNFSTVDKFGTYFHEKLLDPKQEFIKEGECHPYVYAIVEGKVMLKAVKNIVL